MVILLGVFVSEVWVIIEDEEIKSFLVIYIVISFESSGSGR